MTRRRLDPDDLERFIEELDPEPEFRRGWDMLVFWILYLGALGYLLYVFWTVYERGLP